MNRAHFLAAAGTHGRHRRALEGAPFGGQALGLVGKAHHDHEVAIGDRRRMVCRIILVEGYDEARAAHKRHARAARGGVV